MLALGLKTLQENLEILATGGTYLVRGGQRNVHQVLNLFVFFFACRLPLHFNQRVHSFSRSVNYY